MKAGPAGIIDETEDDRAAKEAALIARIVGGESRHYSVLVDRYQRRLFWSCLRLLGDADEADDVVQETFVSAYARLKDYNPDFRFYTWIYRIARNRCLNVLRRRKLWALVSFSDPERAPRIAADEEADRTVEDRELAAALAKCRGALPADQRECFDLRHDEGFRYDEIAATLGIPAGTVMSRLARAREKMRECLKSKGIGWGSEPAA
jgi:RNA polymerase sigma-70 factor (ECF subfamily)